MKLFWPLALMSLIFLASCIPGTSRAQQAWLGVDLDPTVQNALHVPVYGLLQWLWLRCLSGPGRSLVAVIVAAAGVSIGYGILDEFHQLYVPGRYASVQDILLNTLGVVAGTLCFRIYAGRAAGAKERGMP